ncbi:YheC/YheD family protein [Paenibacillus methanolicus]|uniref:YheC/D-like protein n=1 Tax=Paenibacillus methanolicus TaxID=582686 RepID=A0A5S5C5Y4_9BACL|nr:YheC/YheD family protein [Paenibacillus methanolicus]TYP74727.1 YheC/D-like protein [Paenibacillus methanolicus]
MNSFKTGLVGIMVANPQQRKRVLGQYLRHNTTNMKLFSFTPSSIDWKKNTVVGLHRSNRKWVVRRFPLPHVVYNRCYGTNHEIIERLEAAIGSDKCFNHLNQFNKLEIYQRLGRWLSDHLPETVAYDPNAAVHMLDKHKVIYFKPVFGHQGKGVYRVELNHAGEIHIGHHYFSPQTIVNDFSAFQASMQELLGVTPYIIQEGVDIRKINNQTFDIRALVQKNDRGTWSVTNLVSRIASKGSYNTSIYEKACLSQDVLKRLVPLENVNGIVRSIYDISLRSAEIIDTETDYHMGEFSVDIALDDNAHAWIIELNGKPQKELYQGIRKQTAVYTRPMQYAQYLCKR